MRNRLVMSIAKEDLDYTSHGALPEARRYTKRLAKRQERRDAAIDIKEGLDEILADSFDDEVEGLFDETTIDLINLGFDAWEVDPWENAYAMDEDYYDAWDDPEVWCSYCHGPCRAEFP